MFFSIDEVGQSAKYIRLKPPKNSQTKGVSMAEDYTIDKVFGEKLL